MANARGKQFEKCFKDSIPAEMIYYRLKDAPPFVGGENTMNRFTPSNICDAIVCNPYVKKMWWVELKETAGTSLPFTNINWTHAEKLADMERAEFSKGIFLIRFSGKRTGTYCVDAHNAVKYRNEQIRSDNPRKSFSYEWVVENGIELPEKQLRSNYRLDIVPVFGKGDDF